MTVKSVKVRKKSLINDVISLKKPSKLDKIIEKVPKPKGAIPNFGLPQWKLMPLECKIPMIPGPPDAYSISRRKLGKKLWVQNKTAEFNLSDPCNYEMEFAYDSMHDENLTRYFSRESNIRRMLKFGFITKNLDAKCSLKDYNMYRKFLKKLHSDSINQELKHRERLADEKRVIEFADCAAKKEIERLNVEERKVLAREKAQEEREQREEKKLQERRERAAKLQKHLESLERAKREEREKRILNSKAQTDYIRRKRAAAVESTRQEVINTLVALARKEAKRKKTRKQRLAREKEEKRRAIEEKWQHRIHQEELEIARKESALRYAEKQRETFIKNYTKKVERERACLQRRFKKIRRFVTCYMARQVSKSKARSCCKKFRRKKKTSKEGGMQMVGTEKPNLMNPRKK